MGSLPLSPIPQTRKLRLKKDKPLLVATQKGRSVHWQCDCTHGGRCPTQQAVPAPGPDGEWQLTLAGLPWALLFLTAFAGRERRRAEPSPPHKPPRNSRNEAVAGRSPGRAGHPVTTPGAQTGGSRLGLQIPSLPKAGSRPGARPEGGDRLAPRLASRAPASPQPRRWPPTGSAFPRRNSKQEEQHNPSPLT